MAAAAAAAAVLWGSEGAAMVQNACDLGGDRPRASPEHYPRPAQVGMPNKYIGRVA